MWEILWKTSRGQFSTESEISLRGKVNPEIALFGGLWKAYHIVELKEDYTKRVSANNLISVSEETHEKTIKKAYANSETKKEMQRVLRHCLEEWKRIKG